MTSKFCLTSTMNTKTVNYAPMAPVSYWDAQLYDSHHSFVSNLAVDLFELLDPRIGDHYLWISVVAQVTGVKNHKHQAEVTGIDHASTMIKRASQTCPCLNFLVIDASKLAWKEQFDAVFSNAVLHWIKQPEKVISGVCRALNPADVL